MKTKRYTNMKKLMAFCAALCCALWTARAKVVIYPVPQGIYYAWHCDDYTVKVRQKGSRDWLDLYEYKVNVDMDAPAVATMVQFDFSGEVEVWVSKNNGRVGEVDIRPHSKGIEYRREGNNVYFTLDRPQKLSIEFDGDRLHNLHLFANALEENVPQKGDPGVLYFEAGLHEPTDTATQSFPIPSHMTVYLAPGAVLKGRLTVDRAEDVTIRGRGFLLTPPQGIAVTYSKNVTVEGITVINPRHYTLSGGQSENIRIRNLKSFSYQGWSDGLDFMSCSDIEIDDVFLRNSDDCLAFYTHRWDFYGDARNVRVQRSILWADIAHSINIGTHGNTQTEGEVLEDFLFSDIDILEHDEDDPDYQGCMAINVGDHNLARRITFENIRVENIQEGQLFHLRVMYNEKYNTGPGRGVEQIVFRNIRYTGDKDANPSVLRGYGPDRLVQGVRFENVEVRGERLGSMDYFRTNEYVRDVTIE